MYTDTMNNFSSPIRTIGARVDLYNGSALATSFTKNNALKTFKIERAGESKFFGFGICQKLNVHLIDKNRTINITTSNSFDVFLSTTSEYTNPFFPRFFVTETHRDENTNELSITAYDALYGAVGHTVSEIKLQSYTIREFALACAQQLSLGLSIDSVASDSFNRVYTDGANFDGTETLREALNAIAEATQTIYFVNNQGQLVFKRLSVDGPPVLHIGKDQYITLKSGENRRLCTIAHITSLGDNVSDSLNITGSTQYVRDNPFWNLVPDVGELVSAALGAVGGTTINQFECSWRGNPLVELGDKISLATKDNGTVISYMLDDVVSYNGALTQKTQWEYENNEDETSSNPSSLGERLKQVYAKVDKVNKEIEIVTSQSNGLSNEIASLRLTTDGINGEVSKVKELTTGAIEGLNEEITTLTNKVSATVTPEEVGFKISEALEQGASKVETSTGFVFNEQGLNVSKSGSEISTTITEDGMLVYRKSEAVLKAGNEGVLAEDLHATTFLLIGNNSRFEDYGDDRTGCFFVGG